MAGSNLEKILKHTFEQRAAEITKIYQRLSCRQAHFRTVGFAEFRRRSVKLTFEQRMLQITKIEQSLQPNLGHSNLPLPLESIEVPPAALSRSKGGFGGALAPLEASGHGRRHGFWARTGSIWEWHGKHVSAVGSGCGCRLAGGTATQNRAGTSYRLPLGQSWVAIWRPLPLKFCIRSYHPLLVIWVFVLLAYRWMLFPVNRALGGSFSQLTETTRKICVNDV